MGPKFTETKPTLPNRAGDTSTNGRAIPCLQGFKVPSRDTSVNTSKDTVKGLGLPAAQKHVDAASASDPDEKKDKRQWALELLARKSGDPMASSSAKGHGGTKNESSRLVYI